MTELADASALYESCANTLVKRITALIPDNPHILEMDSCWDLFHVPGFKCDDLQPSLSQASWALARAKMLWCDGKRVRVHADSCETK